MFNHFSTKITKRIKITATCSCIQANLPRVHVADVAVVADANRCYAQSERVSEAEGRGQDDGGRVRGGGGKSEPRRVLHVRRKQPLSLGADSELRPRPARLGREAGPVF